VPVIQANQVYRLFAVHGPTAHFNAGVLVGAAKAKLQVHQVRVQSIKRLIILREVGERARIRVVSFFQTTMLFRDKIIAVGVPVFKIRPMCNLEAASLQLSIGWEPEKVEVGLWRRSLLQHFVIATLKIDLFHIVDAIDGRLIGFGRAAVLNLTVFAIKNEIDAKLYRHAHNSGLYGY
jgi:hypothetical protein